MSGLIGGVLIFLGLQAVFVIVLAVMSVLERPEDVAAPVIAEPEQPPELAESA